MLFDEYLAEFNNALPAATPDGRNYDCLTPGDKPVKTPTGGGAIIRFHVNGEKTLLQIL